MGVPITLLIVAVLASGGLFAFLAWRDRQALSFASSVVSENSPIAELATRKIVWKVVHIGSTISTDTVRETVCNKLEKSSRDGNTTLPYLPPEKPVCRSRSNS